jgi:hypothetical protein
MPKSLRIRTELGKDKTVTLNLDQDFEFIEILSVKLSQQELYTRRCADYGVVVGRVSINDGFGLPNVKVGAFIPITSEDEFNPLISSIYPYKSITDINEDGYKYNLLPYKPSYPGHAATGSFPDLEDVLVNPVAIEIYDKYYKFTVTTNDSGDFMIFGLPVGSHRLVINVDLSDIGPFSLSPQDLIRLGIATDSQVNGTKFQTSENITSLPQIVTVVQDVVVSPLWGDDEYCQMSISRFDIDLTASNNIEIKPTAIFMGSIFSDVDRGAIKKNCKPPVRSGNMCSLIAGPGQILAIRQTIKQDNLGRPVLEEFELENNGNVIDDNGTWLLDVPMNLDYIVTNEFGEQVFSNDERKGIPTKAKYRFKVKWNQSPDLGAPIRRANFLIPNVKEYGWLTSNEDPIDSTLDKEPVSITILPQFDGVEFPVDTSGINEKAVIKVSDKINVDYISFKVNGQPVNQTNNIIIEPGNSVTASVLLSDQTIPATLNFNYSTFNYYQLKRSYAFSLNWDDYPDAQEAINCDDKFYEMGYNKVYTISQLLTRFNKGFLNKRFSAIKNITDEECESENYKFPANDAQFKPDFIFTLFSILIIYISIIFRFVVLVLHVICFLLAGILELLYLIEDKTPINVSKPIDKIEQMLAKISGFNLPMYTFPDCELCSCKPEGTNPGAFPLGLIGTQAQAPFANRSVLADVLNSTNYESNSTNGATDFNPIVQTFYAGYQPTNSNYGYQFRTPANLIFTREEIFDPTQSATDFYTSLNLPFHERITLMNGRGKFFGSGGNRGAVNPNQESPLNKFTINLGGTDYTYYLGGGTNQIKVCFNKNLNNPNLLPDFEQSGNVLNQSLMVSNLVNNYDNLGFHYDNVVILLTEETYEKGTLLTFDNPSDYRDLNLSGSVQNQFGTTSITGTSVNDGISQIYISHTHPLTGKRLRTKYNISGDSSQNQFLRFPTGLEYYQVVESMNGQAFIDQYWGGVYSNRDKMQSFAPYNRMFVQSMQIATGRLFSTAGGIGSGINWQWSFIDSPYNIYSDTGGLNVTILMRGVDPHSTSQPMKIGLGRLFGKQDHWAYSVEGNFKMNIPLQPNDGIDFGVAPGGNSQTIATTNAQRCTRHNLVGTNNEPNQKDNGYTDSGLFYKSYHFKPNQNQWEPFNTTSVYNYITTSENDWGNNMLTGGYPEPLFLGDDQSTYLKQTTNFYTFKTNPSTVGGGLRIGINNFYTRNTHDGVEVGLGTPTAANSNGDEIRFQWSYQPGESVEGLPFMCLLGDSLDNGLPTGPALNFARYQKLQPIYYSRRYAQTTPFTMTNSERIVMRSDRLPTSDVYQNIGPNSFGGMANGNFKVYTVPIDGIVTTGFTQPPIQTFVINEPEPIESGETPNVIGKLLETFSCGSLVPIECYAPNPPDGVQLAPSGTCMFTSYERDGETYRTQFFVEGSCYSLVRPPYLQPQNLLNDYQLINEWSSRININFGACREVFSHLFVNNWINGTLYMVPFKTKRFFTGPLANPPSQPYNKYCEQTVFLEPESFNFYYRSAPWKTSSQSFIGREGYTPLGVPVGNTKNHMYPTTIMDLGPRDELQKYLSQSGNWDGYIMNKLEPTSFGDTSEILNIFILSRLVNTSFTNVFKSRGATVLKFFDNRKKRYVDADFAQMIATNSQFGIAAYDPENYPEPPPDDVLYSSSLFLRTDFSGPKDTVFGIFYDGDSQARDYISPNRTVYDEDADIGDPCGVGNIPTTTQIVPFYLWNIKPNSLSNIFGAQNNEWQFTPYPLPLQGVDRLNTSGNIINFQPDPSITQIKYHKGWIYNVENLYNPYTEQLDYKPQPGIPGGYLMGAPFYFYFGLKQGASAFDRFSAKWIDTEGLE